MKNKLTNSAGLKIISLILPCLFLISGCKKDLLVSNSDKLKRNISIDEAKQYFEKNILAQKVAVKTTSNSTSSIGGKTSSTYQDDKLPMWDASELRGLSIGVNAVLVPLYKQGAYIHISEKQMVKYGFLNYMMMRKDSLGNMITEWVELKPTEKWANSKVSRKYDGSILVREWNGKIKKLYTFNNGTLVPTSKNKINKKANIKGLMTTPSTTGDVTCLVTTTTTIKNIPAKPCPCDGHTWGQVCNCYKTPTKAGQVIQVTVTYDCDLPDDPTDPTDPNGNPGGSGSGDPNNTGGGSPNPSDYTPINCNPDPDYVVPTIPPPPGTEYILPCSSLGIPIEGTPDDPTIDTAEPKTMAEILIDWYNSDADAQMHLSDEEKLFLNGNPQVANSLSTYLTSELREVKEFGRWAIGYLNENSDATFDELTVLNNIPNSSVSLPPLDVSQLTSYPKLKQLVENLPSFLNSYPNILKALSVTTGFTEKKIKQLMQPGNGPKVIVVNNLSDSQGNHVLGQYDNQNNILKIDKNYVNDLDHANTPTKYQGMGLMLTIITLHEFVHYGRDMNNLPRRMAGLVTGTGSIEAGVYFEDMIMPPGASPIEPSTAAGWLRYYKITVRQ